MSQIEGWEPLEKYVGNLVYPDPARRRLTKFFNWCSKTPQQILDLQKTASLSADDGERYRVADLVEKYLKGKTGRLNTKVTDLGTIRGFFQSNRRPIPKIPNLKLRSDRELVSNKLTAEMLQTVLTALRNDPRKRSMILTQFQSFSGVKELMLISQNYGYEIGEKIKADQIPIQLEMKWQRKGNENPYYTFIGAAACQALKEYFEGPRGYPQQGEPIWYGELSKKGEAKKNRKQEPLTALGYRIMWMRLTAPNTHRRIKRERNARNGSGTAQDYTT
jgi:hypothetical protein